MFLNSNNKSLHTHSMWSHRSLGLAITSISLILSLFFILGSSFLFLFISRKARSDDDVSSRDNIGIVILSFELIVFFKIILKSRLFSNFGWRWRFWDLN